MLMTRLSSFLSVLNGEIHCVTEHIHFFLPRLQPVFRKTNIHVHFLLYIMRDSKLFEVQSLETAQLVEKLNEEVWLHSN